MKQTTNIDRGPEGNSRGAPSSDHDDGRESVPCAKVLKVLADETRLAVMEQLLDGDRSVGAINERLKIEQSLLSHHLRVLRDAGLVSSRREGKQVLYSLADQVVHKQTGRAINLGCCLISFNALV